VAVTFDDGYAETALTAAPILRYYGVPATSFITTGMFDGGHEMWWDAMAHVLLELDTLPESLEIKVAGVPFCCALGPDRHRCRTGVDRWVAWAAPANRRHASYQELWARCQRLPQPAIDDVLRQLWSWAGTSRVVRDSHRVVSRREMQGLAPEVEIGAHTMTHPVLAALEPEAQHAEIVGSRRELEASLGSRAISSFAYPFGKATDYTAETIQLLREAGFVRACANVAGAVTATTDPYQIPRLFVPDVDASGLSRLIAEVLASADAGSAYAVGASS
jgi:peptidoglycan/xylan/chitin deacetylase (PgdA/CDA1 family)